MKATDPYFNGYKWVYPKKNTTVTTVTFSLRDAEKGATFLKDSKLNKYLTMTQTHSDTWEFEPNDLSNQVIAEELERSGLEFEIK